VYAAIFKVSTLFFIPKNCNYNNAGVGKKFIFRYLKRNFNKSDSAHFYSKPHA